MLELTHFIWLGIALVIIIGMLLLSKFKELSYNTVLTIIFWVSVASELVKILNNMELGYKNGMFLDPGSLPFHLCSIQIFFIGALKFFIKKEETRNKVLNFIFPTALVGGVLALFIPTCGTSFSRIQPYQYFIFHSFLVFFSIYIIKMNKKIVNLKTFGRNMAYLSIMALFDIWVNSLLHADNCNFMYLSRPPMDNLPLLNLDNGWYVYIVTFVCLATVLMFLIHLPFIIINRKKSNSLL